MATLNMQAPEASHGAPGPPVPPGWLANWSPEHNAWFYVYTPTGATQWDYPTPPPDHSQYPPPHQDYQSPPPGQSPYSPEPGGDDTHVAGGDRGLGKAALALGGGLLAGSSLRAKFEQHHSGHSSGHGLGSLTQSAAIAGAGAIGAKIFGLFGNKPQAQQQQPLPQQPAPQTQVHVYPVYVPGPQGVPPQGPSPGQSPMYHGQVPPVNQNASYFPAGGAVGGAVGVAAGVAASMTASPQTPHPEGVPSHAIGGGVPTFTHQSVPPLYIHGAVFADRDVTMVVRNLVTPLQTLSLSGEKLCEQLGDPWPEVSRKMFNVLYSYGDRPMELLAVSTTNDIIEIKHEAISKQRMEFCRPPPSRIIACVWGVEDALTAPRIEQLEKEGEMEGSGNTLGAGGFWGWEPKTLVCYYRTETGGVGIAFCRDGGTVRLPWNPLAKWS